MKIALPPELFGGNPAGLLEHLGLHIDRRPSSSEPSWEVSTRPGDLVTAQTLHGPALSRSRFDVSAAPTPEVPGGMSGELVARFNKLARDLDDEPSLSSRFERVVQMLVAVPDSEVPASIKWGSELLADIQLTHLDGSSEPLFPRHSVHDIRITNTAYRWAKLPQIFFRLKHNTVAEIIAASAADPDQMAFESSGALLEGTIFGGLYVAPLLGNLSPNMWGFGAPRFGQVVVYALGRQVPGRSQGASRSGLDSLQILTQHSISEEFDVDSLDDTTLHKAAYSDAIEWWTARMNDTMLDLFDPTTYVDEHNFYSPAAHQRWMLNFEHLLARISAIGRHPRDMAAQLVLMSPRWTSSAIASPAATESVNSCPPHESRSG